MFINNKIIEQLHLNEKQFSDLQERYALIEPIASDFYHPYEDVRFSPGSIRIGIEIEYLQKMALQWQNGLINLRKAASFCAAHQKTSADKMIGLGSFMHHTIITVINVKKWWILNQKILLSTDRSAALRLLDEMKKLAEDEIKNASATIPLVEADSRLGWEPSMEYMTDAAHLQWKIKQVRHVIDVQLRDYRKSITAVS